MPRPEVLSPAGGWESLTAAAAAGADAVYFGGRSFNARRNAGNFSDEEIAGAIAYCHARGIRAYITLNTLMFERELVTAMDFVRRLCEAGADAVIVQDPGLAELIRAAAPGLRLHASTQMSVHNPEGVRLLYRMGFSRVVAAREVSAASLAEMVKCSPAEIEVFVHGALCMSVSGQCYLSAMLGGRSGNRGLCAQPCRLEFAAPGGTGHDLSLKDLSLIGQIPELARMGAASLKIEGRMKRPEYVAAATAACARAARGEEVSAQETERLRAVFSRSGFTKGYFEDRPGRAMFGVRSREDVQAMQDVLSGYRALYTGAETPRVRVDFIFTARAGKNACLSARDDDGNTVEIQGKVPEAARTRALDAEEVRARLSKTGGTPFFTGGIQVELDGGLSLPAAEINRLRREALDGLLEQRRRPRRIPFSAPAFSTVSTGPGENRRGLRIRLRHMEQLTAAVEAGGAEMIWLPVTDIGPHARRIRELQARGICVGAELPRAMFGPERARVAEAMKAAREAGVRDMLCGNLGALEMAAAGGFAVHGDFGLNCANSRSLAALRKLGAADCVLSFEATVREAASAAASAPMDVGLIAFGRLPLMLTRNCPLKNGAGCAACAKAPGALRDRKGMRFPVACFGGASEVLNSVPLWMGDRQKELYGAGARFACLYFSIETPAEVDDVLRAWKEGRPADGEFTRGLYIRGVE